MRKFTANELQAQRQRQLDQMVKTYNEFDPKTENMDDDTSVQMSANELFDIITAFEDLLNQNDEKDIH